MAPTREIIQSKGSSTGAQSSPPSASSSVDSSPNSPPSLTFQGMLDRLEVAFSRSDNKVDTDDLWRILEGYKSNPDDWSKYAFYDERKYKRNLVAEYEKYNVMILTWAPGAKSTIHDHSGAHCFMKTLDGELVESRFAWPDEDTISRNGEMSRISDNLMETDDCLYINDKVGLHQVENSSKSKAAASLHVYIPPYRACKAFDQSTGQSRVCKLSFYSERGVVIGQDERNPWSESC